MTHIPYVIERDGQHEKIRDIYTKLFQDRIIFIGTAINSDVANAVVAQLLYLSADAPNEDINMYINSPGGVVPAGLSIFDTMCYIPCDITTIGLGVCASMGAFLLAAGTKGKRKALPNTKIMIHQPSGGASGQATDIWIAAEEILKTKEKLTQYMARFTGQPYERVYDDCERDNYMTTEEALDYGVIDAILEHKEDG